MTEQPPTKEVKSIDELRSQYFPKLANRISMEKMSPHDYGAEVAKEAVKRLSSEQGSGAA